MTWDGPKWGQEVLFPANPDLADILGDTDFDFDNFYSLTLRVVAVDPNLSFPCREHPCREQPGFARALPLRRSRLRRSARFGRSGGAALRIAFGIGQRFALPWGAFGAPVEGLPGVNMGTP